MEKEDYHEQADHPKENFEPYQSNTEYSVDLETLALDTMKKDFSTVGDTLLEYFLWTIVFSILFMIVSIPMLFGDGVASVEAMVRTTSLVMIPGSLLGGIVTIHRGCRKLQISKQELSTKSSWSFTMILKYVVIMLGLSTLAGFVTSFLNFLLSFVGMQFTTPDIAINTDLISNLATMISVLVVAPIFEELLCRGLVLKTLLRYDQRFAILMSALMFAFLHGNLLQGLPAFVMGMVLAYVFIKSGSILPCIILHFLNNVFALGGNYLIANIAWMEIIMSVISILMCLFAVSFILAHRKDIGAEFSSKAKEKQLYRIFFQRFSIVLITVFMLFMTFSEYFVAL